MENKTHVQSLLIKIGIIENKTHMQSLLIKIGNYGKQNAHAISAYKNRK